MNLSEYASERVPAIEEVMLRSLETAPKSRFLYDLAREYPERGGKRFRGVLALIACEACGGEWRSALPAAAAFEIFQSFALVHDDIEDDSFARRGGPCLHRVHGIPLSLNAGDLLFGKAFEVMLNAGPPLDCQTVVSSAKELVQGSIRTFEGQALDLGWIQDKEIPSVDEVLHMLRCKTGWYSGKGPCRLGALAAGADETLREDLGQFGEKMAMAFQIKDDLLNLTVEEDAAGQAPGVGDGGYGKERGGDIMEGKRTYIVIHALDRLEGGERDALVEILDRPRSQTDQDSVESAIALMEAAGSLQAAEDLSATWLKEAVDGLEELELGPHKELLRQMAQFLVLDRTM